MKEVGKKIFIGLWAVGILFCSQEYLQAEESTYLDKVVVSAAKKESTLLETPATIDIITSQDIERMGQREVSKIIATVPGVIDDGSGSGTYFSFRGTRSSTSGGPVVYIDGRPLNFGKYGYSNIDDIPVELVERIEIIKAPPASQYGTNSARGVINIVTKSGKYAQKPIEVTLRQGIGVWETYNTHASAYGKKNQWDYNIGFTREESDGYRGTDPEKTIVNGQVGYLFDEKVRLGAFFDWSDTWNKSGKALKHWNLEDRRDNEPWDSEAMNYRVRPNERDHELLSGGLSFKYDKDNWLLNSNIGYSHFDDIYDSLTYYNREGNGTTQRGQGCYRDERDEDKFDLKLSGGRTFTNDDNFLDTFTLGYDYESTDWDQVRSYPYATSLSASRQTTVKKNTIQYDRDIHGFFANNDLKYGKWGLLGGLRYDYVEYDVKNELPDSVKKDFRELSWDIAPSFSFTPETNLYLSLGTNYWYPNTAYFTYALDYDEPTNQPQDLKPEEYMNYEIGFKHQLAKYLNYNVALFRSEIDHKYLPHYNDSGSFKGYKHIGSAVHQGIELGADGRPFDWFGYRFGFTWLDAEWDDAKTKVTIYGATPAADTTEVTDISGKKVYRVPEYEFLIGADFYPVEKLTLSVDVHGFGECYIDALNRYKDKAVTLVDMKAKYAFTKNFEMYLLGSNIFDVDYESVFNTTGDRNADGTPDHDYYPKDGRYFEIGATVRF